MNRRKFLKSSAAVTAAQALPWSSLASAAAAGWRSFETVTRVAVADPFGMARAWVPLPLTSDYDWHRTLDNSWSGNASRAEVLRDPVYGLSMLYVEWPEKEMDPVIQVTSRFMTRERTADFSAPRNNERLVAGERRFFTGPTELIPTDGIVRDTALKITQGTHGDVEKARAIYEWIVDNTFRDAKVKGCGVGDIKAMLETGNLGGKCADLNA
ncbi:MAG TPA: twin-arginine translocation signal domain-containing protein, partial [Burkholderiales bacterium]|nr:twin-arginine translocation signal domain-containing protein [Burkholderiales bacterium]